MAIVQISQIKHRRGLAENGPGNGLQLASAELGWNVDTQELYIGNGTLAEGAPEVGNTAILTAVSWPNYIPVPGTNAQTLQPNTSNVGLLYSVGTTAGQSVIFNSTVPSVSIDYAIMRSNDIRTGVLTISQINGNLSYSEDYTETANIGVVFTVGKPTGTSVNVSATTSNNGSYPGIAANLQYKVSSFTF